MSRCPAEYPVRAPEPLCRWPRHSRDTTAEDEIAAPSYSMAALAGTKRPFSSVENQHTHVGVPDSSVVAQRSQRPSKQRNVDSARSSVGPEYLDTGLGILKETSQL